MPLTGFDWNAPYRMPQGWTTLPDGSVGPSSQVPDWLKQLIPSPGASQPYGPSGYPDNLPARPYGPPGGGLNGMPGATPGGPSMGFPAQGGPDIYPPQNSTIPPMKSVGPFTGGTSTEGASTGSWADPRTWFKGGQPLDAAAAGGGFNPLSFFARSNPYARAAIAAGGVLSPTPAETGELPLSLSGARPEHPHSTGAMPRAPYDPLSSIQAPAQPPGSGPGGQPPYTAMPWRGPVADAPAGNPSDTPRPTARRPATVAQAPAKPPSSNPRFGTFQYQVPGAGGPLSRSPIYTSLNLFGGR